MSSHTVDGVLLPVPVAGHPVLEFCNTRAGWNADTPREYLTSPRALDVWCREAGLVAAVPADAEVLRRALVLREALYGILTSTGTAEDAERVAAEAGAARAASRLVLDGGLPGRWQLVGATPLTAVAASAADLLTGPLATSVGRCPGAGCGWLFSDPRRRRRWCTMAVCGNRAKARRHRGGHAERAESEGIVA